MQTRRNALRRMFGIAGAVVSAPVVAVARAASPDTDPTTLAGGGSLVGCNVQGTVVINGPAVLNSTLIRDCETGIWLNGTMQNGLNGALGR